MKKLLKISSALAIVAGILIVIGGIWGITFTYKNIAQEKIVTPAGASISEKPVRGPFTLKAQADIIREHTLNRQMVKRSLKCLDRYQSLMKTASRFWAQMASQ